ncbi:cupin domain-containing protein [Megasphaera hominis]|jgi:quercetin dioxygenase-like cupin family protein|uniref:Cupin domain-containing protein n=1 Tax=Megasphaera hominis TaxID=159836 RepID=A0ABR6VEW8_9FIRM|nr:cupin domain-containing protein [Megasphaera hominis]MBC3535700.1 cupin domain-containing protein [Megasphaera hominis]
MLIDFSTIKEMTMPCMNDGTGTMTVRMFNDDAYRIIPTRIHPGGCIGTHRQDSGDDLNYVLSGTGRAICDGQEELLQPGVMHICPQGSEHTIENTGDEDLLLLTLVVKK